MSLTVEGPNPEPAEFRWNIVVAENRDNAGLADELQATLAQLRERDEADGLRAPAIQLWIRDVDQAGDQIASDLGFRRYRDLWQLRCQLPNVASLLETRAFTDDDIDAFVGVNNRAFHWHPEQSGLTADAVRETMTEPWFSHDGFRLLDDAEGELIGFCWTKIHRDVEPNLGEIYVIAIDPSQHGKGLGKPMTLAGLEWLAEQGLEHGMLYVESDNDPANATYAAIGFSRHHTDRAYRLEP